MTQYSESANSNENESQPKDGLIRAVAVASGQEVYREDELEKPGATYCSSIHIFSLELHPDCLSYEEVERNLPNVADDWTYPVPANPAFTVHVGDDGKPFDREVTMRRLNEAIYKPELAAKLNESLGAVNEQAEESPAGDDAKFVRITFSWDWADEISGSWGCVMPEFIWDKFRDEFTRYEYGLSMTVGSNQFIEYQNGSSVLGSVRSKPATAKEYRAALTLFSVFGWGDRGLFELTESADDRYVDDERLDDNGQPPFSAIFDDWFAYNKLFNSEGQ